MKVEYGIMSNKWSVNTEYVDGEHIKGDTWYRIYPNGEFEEI